MVNHEKRGGFMANVYRSKLDLKSLIIDFKPIFVQYDHACLEIELLDNGLTYDLSNVEYVDFTHVLENDTVIIHRGEIIEKDNKKLIFYEYIGSEMDQIGTIKTSFALFDADRKKVSSHKFEVEIVEDLRDETFNPSEPNFGLLQTLITDVDELKERFNDGGVPIEEPLPTYWETHVADKINRIKALQDEDGINRLSIGFITDMHLEGNNDGYSGKLMSKIDDECNLSLVINGGDCVSHKDGNISKESAISQMREMFRMFSPSVREKMIYVVGNHDDNTFGNRSWQYILKDGELYSNLFRHLDNKVVRGESPKYYYVDNEFHKIRFIALDAIDIPYINVDGKSKYLGHSDYGYRQKQLEWFANKALNIPNNTWSVIVVTHVPPFAENVGGYHRDTRNSEIALGILGAFKNRGTYSGNSLSTVESEFQVNISADFTGKGGDVICWVTGHVHTDNIVDSPNGITLVTTLNDHKTRLSSSTSGTSGTISEQAFDIFTIDKANKRVYLTRIGMGSDREFEYGRNTILFQDIFSRPDTETLGGIWEVIVGNFTISGSSRAKAMLVDGATSIAVVNVGVSDNVSVETRIVTNDNEGLVVRLVDAHNYIGVMIDKNKELLITVVENDVKTHIARKAFERGSSHVLKVELVGNEIRLFIDDVLELTGTTNKFISATKYGLNGVTSGSTNGSFDDFIIKNI